MEQNNKQPLMHTWMPLALAIALIGGILIGMNMTKRSIGHSLLPTVDSSTGGTGKVEELLRYIDSRYVDDVDLETLEQTAIASIIDKLDPHSSYIPAKDLEGVNEQLDGNFRGIGIEFRVMDDTIMVMRPIAGGPSEAVGIMAGDQIITVTDTMMAGINVSSQKIMDMLRGEEGSKVKIQILRHGEDTLRTVQIERGIIPVSSVEAAFMLDEKTGVIKLSRFTANTYREFMQKVEFLHDEKGMEDLVIDLRGNPGGYLEQATRMLSQMFPDKDKLLVYTEGAKSSRADYESKGRSFFQLDDIAVLIDEGSASASEIIAGALQDQDRAVIVGRRSFGKGLVQEQYLLRDGAALRLTVARYFTPTGRSIQKPYADKDAYDKEMYNRYTNGEIYSQDSVKVTDSTEFLTLVDGRKMFGGGGISPDVFIPLDSLTMDTSYLYTQQWIPEFAFKKYLKYPTRYDEMKLDEFKKQFQVTDNMLDNLIAYANQKNDTNRFVNNRKIRLLLKNSLKAQMARQWYGEDGMYSVLFDADPMVEEAEELLETDNPMQAVKELE